MLDAARPELEMAMAAFTGQAARPTYAADAGPQPVNPADDASDGGDEDWLDPEHDVAKVMAV